MAITQSQPLADRSANTHLNSDVTMAGEKKGDNLKKMIPAVEEKYAFMALGIIIQYCGCKLTRSTGTQSRTMFPLRIES